MSDAYAYAYGLEKENLLFTFPVGLRENPTIAALGDVTMEALAKRPAEIALLSIYPRIDELPEALLDILAYDFKVDWWDRNYSIEEKRRTLKGSWRVHKMLGTRKAVETAIQAIYPKTEVREWFEYGGRPYHFKLYIDLSGEKWSEERPRRVLDRVKFYKSLRSHMEEFQFTAKPREPALLRLGGTMSAVASFPIPEKRDVFDFRSAARLGGRQELLASIPVPQAADQIELRGALRAGGRAAARAVIPIPEA